MKAVVVYKGKYGATRQYAEWIGEALNLPVYPADDIRDTSVVASKYIIIGSSVYIGKLQINAWLKKEQPAIKWKKIFFFQVSGTAPEKKEELMRYFRSGMPADLQEQCGVFFLEGRLTVARLPGWDRFMLKIGTRQPKKIC